MSAKAPIYSEKDQADNAELLSQLREAVDELERKMRAATTISRGGHQVGWGVNKAQRSIAADSVISITKAIKVLKGW